MPAWLAQLLQMAPVLILIIPAVLSGLNWISRKLKEQAELQRIQQERERRKLEALRTGRFEHEPEAVAAAEERHDAAPEQAAEAQRREQLAELAARRQRQLAELRRQRQVALQQAAQRGPAQPGQFPPGAGVPPHARARTAPPPIPGSPRSAPSGDADIQRRRAEAQARLRSRQEEIARQQQRNQVDRQRTDTLRRAEADRDHRAAATAAGHDFIEQTQITDGAISARRARPQDLRLQPSFVIGRQFRPIALDQREMRRAIILAEILSPPVGLRPDGQSPGTTGNYL